MKKILQSTGRTSYTMVMQIVGAVINIILDPIFIFGYFGLPAMGTRGAAIATVTGQIVAMLLGLYFNLTQNKDVQLNFKFIELESYYFKGICTVGIPTIIIEMLPVQLISAFAPSEEMFSLGVTALRILGLSFVFGGISVMTCYALQGFSRGISSLVISALRQVIILLPLASILGKVIGINGIWWSFLISETVTVILAIIYLGIAEKKEFYCYIIP